jgi:hypothetical protein
MRLLVDDLKAHRLQIARAHLAGDFGVAFDLALYSLCVDLFERFGYRSHPLDLRAVESELHSSLNDLSGTPADRLLETRRKALNLDWLKLLPAEGFQALSALRPRPSSVSSPAASLHASSRSSRSRTGPTRSWNPPAGGLRSRSPIIGGRPPPTTGAG